MRVGNIHEPQTGVDVPEVPTEGQTQTLRCNGDTPLFHASGTWTMTEEMRKKRQTIQRRMLMMIIQTKRHAKQGIADAFAANVDDVADDVADDEPTTQTASQRKTRLKPSHKPQRARRTQPRRRQQPLFRQSSASWTQARMNAKHHDERYGQSSFQSGDQPKRWEDDFDPYLQTT